MTMLGSKQDNTISNDHPSKIKSIDSNVDGNDDLPF